MPIERLRLRQFSVKNEQGAVCFAHLNVEFPLHQFVLIEGAAGAGKSLLLKIMAGLVLPEQGGYYINDTNVSALSFAGFLPYRLNIGYSFEHGGLIGNKTVLENLMLPLQYHADDNAQQARRKAQAQLERFGLLDIQDAYPADLSSTYWRRVVVARALILKPELLLLDNPGAGLGHADRQLLVDLLKEQRAHGGLKHVFIVSPQAAFLDELISARLSVDQGNIYPCENPHHD